MYVYIVSNPFMQHKIVKIGYMSTRPETILSRYKTYYGMKTTVMCWFSKDAISLEKQFMNEFKLNHVEMELYDATYVMHYIHWLTTTTQSTPYVCTGTTLPTIPKPVVTGVSTRSNSCRNTR